MADGAAVDSVDPRRGRGWILASLAATVAGSLAAVLRSME